MIFPKKVAQSPDDVGTLWTLARRGQTARCALMAWPGTWEVRVLVDGKILEAQRCARGAEAFKLADDLKKEMILRGWRQLLPNVALRREDAAISA